MKIVERLLMREEIDSLELDLARARETGDGGAISEICTRIGRLEAALAIARRDDVQIVGRELGRSVRRAA